VALASPRAPAVKPGSRRKECRRLDEFADVGAVSSPDRRVLLKPAQIAVVEAVNRAVVDAFVMLQALVIASVCWASAGAVLLSAC
jgi:hypothetical protein